MPPRRSRRSQAQDPSSFTIAWLSDDVLAKCFASLNQKDRVCNAALVCRRWLAVSTRPELLREVVFTGNPDPANAMPAAQSLLWWLKRHGPTVRKFHATLWDLGAFGKAQETEVMSALDSWLALCSAGLEKLTVRLDHDSEPSFTLNCWVLAAPRLRKLRIEGAYTLNTWITLQAMTALQRLEIETGDWQLGSAVMLPARLTRLDILRHDAGDLPSQVAALTNLRSLTLSFVDYSAVSMASLTQLTALQHACFEESEVPDSLPQLTGLQVLRIINPHEDAASLVASLDTALRQLTQMTGLWLGGLPPGMTAPPSLASLGSLDWLLIETSENEGSASASEAVLPPGPWQRSLRLLATALPLAQRSLKFMSEAERLQRLCILGRPVVKPVLDERWKAFWCWAGTDSALQYLGIEMEEIWPVSASLMRAALDLKAQRPALSIDSWLTRRSLRKELLAEWK